MNALARVLPFALLTTIASAADGPETNVLPPFLLPAHERPVIARAPADAPLRQPSSLSEHTRQILSAKFIAPGDAEFGAPPRFAGALPGNPLLGDATLMKPVIVEGLRYRGPKFEWRDPPVWHFVKSGEFVRYSTRAFDFSGYFGLLSITSRGLTPRESTRMSLSFTLRW